MDKKKLTLEVIERLAAEYPDADCTLDYDEAWKLLVSVRLAAQCTDARVNVIVEELYKKYPDVNALAEASPEEIEEIVRPCGLGRSKARDISACMRVLQSEYGGNVPDSFDALLALPGVTLLSDRPFGNEFAVCLPKPAQPLVDALIERYGVVAGYPVGRHYQGMDNVLLVACTEKNTREQIDRLVESLGGLL